MLGHSYTPPIQRKGSFTMDNTVTEMKDYSLVMKIMFKAVESTVAKGFGGKKDYENPDFRMMMNASLGRLCVSTLPCRQLHGRCDSCYCRCDPQRRHSRHCAGVSEVGEQPGEGLQKLHV